MSERSHPVVYILKCRADAAAPESPLDDGNKATGAFSDAKWKSIFAEASSETVRSIATGVWSPSEDPSKDRDNLGGIRRYGASKLCLTMMM